MTQPKIDVSIIRQAVTPNVAKAAYGVFRELRIASGSLYVPKAELAFSDTWLGSYGEAVETFAKDHCDQLAAIAKSQGVYDFHGFEIWTNLAVDCPTRVVVHVDNDEVHRAATGEVRNPVLGSILHLGPDNLEQGGGTCFFLNSEKTTAHSDFLFQSTAWETVRETIGYSAIEVPFHAGQMVIFRGDLAHCVIPFEKSHWGPRVAFLVNLWSRPLVSAAQ